ncbi:MAG: hypothetical protein SVU32_08885 [Candidatus Nanohaloarchaea archaeon]|nr:hypothetical protein [Candidatus Nanohaloarchaea archaeon]
MVLDRFGPDSLLWKLTGTIKNIGTPEEEQLQQLEPAGDPDPVTLLDRSERVYAAEPADLWDETIGSGLNPVQQLLHDPIGKQFLHGTDAADGIRDLEEWDITDSQITYFHTNRTLGYDMNVQLEHQQTGRQETLFYIGDLEYGISQDHAPAYLNQFNEPRTATLPDRDTQDEVLYEEWLPPEQTHEPPYLTDERIPADEAYTRLKDATPERVIEQEDSYRIKAREGEKYIIVETV